ncbi:MAG: hypothetical protein JSW61_10020 [Candidatus Thorarchaeota archaeon]|nr:MAG: hypothetical protein JSW61_10020 [Candidatus Thorarchaeota archaeon]
MKKRLTYFLSLLLLAATPVSQVGAIPTGFGGALEMENALIRILPTNPTYFAAAPDFFHYPWEAEVIRDLAESGVRVNMKLDWWAPFFNGEIAWNTTAIDFCYNLTLLELLDDEIDWYLSFVEPEWIWALTLSSEEPAGSLAFFSKQDKYEKLNTTYNSETGFWLRWETPINKTEEFVLWEWQREKTIWLFNHIYDYLKAKWPDVLVFQAFFMHPGAPPVWTGGMDISQLKADAYIDNLFYYMAYDNPFWMYEWIRAYKTAFPEKDYHFTTWGQETWPENEGWNGGFEHLRRNAWLTYLSGVDTLTWFTWHYLHGWNWGREDVLGKQQFLYMNRLNAELEKMPVFKPKSQILVLRDYLISYQTGFASEYGLFNEYDVLSQVNLMNLYVNLSQYEVIIANEEAYYEEVVQKLNDYVASGGNLVLLGGFGWEQKNVYANATRSVKFLMETGVIQEQIGGHLYFNETRPNMLNLSIEYDSLESSIHYLRNDTLTHDHTPIGDFYHVEEDSSLTKLDYHPLVMYRNSSNPDEGWTLYWGPRSSRTNHNPMFNDVVDTFLPEHNQTRFLHRNVTRAFLENRLNLTTPVAQQGYEKMLVTQAEIEPGVILAGISNFYNEPRSLNYTLDIGRFGLPTGSYYVHSIDTNETLGSYATSGTTLEVPLDVQANGTRLLLISQEQQESPMTINIFPDIPTPEEVENLWPTVPLTTTTTTPSTTTSTTTTTTTTTTTLPLGFPLELGVALATAAGGVVVIIILYTRRRNGSEVGSA